MTIQFNCPYCTSTLKVPDSTAGKQGDCPRCGTKLVIPNPIQAELQPSGVTEKTPPAAQPESQPSETASAPVPEPSTIKAESRPMSSMTAQYLRRRKKSNVGAILLSILFLGMMLGIAVYFYMIYGPNLEGHLVAARFENENIQLEEPLNAKATGLSDEQIAAVNQNFHKSTRRVQSDLMDVVFAGTEEGALKVLLKAGADTELVRVDLTGDPALMDYIKKNAANLDEARLKELNLYLKQFYDEWYPFVETGGVMPDLLIYRNHVALNSLLGGFGYHVEARVNHKIYPCVHEDTQGGLYFLVPRGTLRFEIVGRKMDNGWTKFPGKYEVQVTQEYPSLP